HRGLREHDHRHLEHAEEDQQQRRKHERELQRRGTVAAAREPAELSHEPPMSCAHQRHLLFSRPALGWSANPVSGFFSDRHHVASKPITTNMRIALNSFTSRLSIIAANTLQLCGLVSPPDSVRTRIDN